MNILALDTTMRACSAAVLRDAAGEGALFRRHEARERGHAEAIMPLVDEVMAEAGLAYAALERIAVTTGPGTFTGVRVGVAAARGLALATGARVSGITSLAVIARRVMETGETGESLVAVAADARRGQVYFALFDASGRALCDHVAVTPDEAARLLPAGRTFVLAGSGAALVAEAAPERAAAATFPDLQPDAGVLARMAAEREPDSRPVSPFYLRPPDVRPQSGKTVTRL